MRVLIADRNVRLLESFSLAFAHQFNIHIASTRKRCVDLLRQSEFDLIIVCEKLADGSGLQLLAHITRISPDTLRIFAAKRSRLQNLKGRLRPFGLFRTLSYPIDARRLLSTLSFARAGLLQIDRPAPGIAHVVLEERQAPLTVRLASPSAAIAPRLPSQSASFKLALARRERVRSSAQSPPIATLPVLATAPHTARNAQSAPSPSKRAKLFLGATLVAVFLVTTLTLRLLDATAQSSSAQATLTTNAGGFSALHAQIERPDVSSPSPASTPAGPPSSVGPARNSIQPAAPKPNSARPDVATLESQMAAAGSTPIADPSTFGTEAAEPIYAN